MALTITIEKKHLFILSAVFGILIGILAVNALTSGTGGTPSIMGHSVDEIDWSKPIDSIVTVGKGIIISKPDDPTFRLENTNAQTFDLISDSSNNFVIKDLDEGASRLVISPLGFVGIGTTTPVEKLDVNGRVLIKGKHPITEIKRGRIDTNPGDTNKAFIVDVEFNVVDAFIAANSEKWSTGGWHGAEAWVDSISGTTVTFKATNGGAEGGGQSFWYIIFGYD